jgi:hypothetical protein
MKTTRFVSVSRLGRILVTALALAILPAREAFSSPNPIADLVPSWWTVVEDVKPSQFQMKDIEFVTYLHEDETSISGDEMRRRAAALKANLGILDGKYLLDHQDEIPKDMRDKYIVLSGALLRNYAGVLHVAVLCFVGGRWHIGFTWLVDGWRGSGRLPLRK